MKQFFCSRVPAALLLALLTIATVNAEETKDSSSPIAASPTLIALDCEEATWTPDAAALAAKADKDQKDFRPFQLLKDGHGAPAVARALTQTFMTDEEFKQEVERVRVRFADFEKDTQRDMSNYLNDRLVIHGLAAANGKIEKIKKGLIWLSMYNEFQQPAPAFVEKFIKDNIDSLTPLFKDFNWDRASNYIKNREWRTNKKDEEKKTASAE